MKSLTFGRSKTVSNTLISYRGSLYNIDIFSLRKKPTKLWIFVFFSRSWEKITRCRMRSLDTVLESSDTILFSFLKILTIRTHPEELLAG